MQIKLDDKIVEATAEETILSVAKRVGIFIPTLCFDPDLKPTGNCRLCVCEVNGKLKSACDTLVQEGMVVETKSEKVIRARRLNIELHLARIQSQPPSNTYNELLRLQKEYDVTCRFQAIQNNNFIPPTTHSIQLDPSLCILCGRCVEKCQQTQSVYAICFDGRGFETKINTPFGCDLSQSTCINCGQCALTCPTGAISEVNDTDKVEAALNDPDKFVIVQFAPSLRVTIGEEFGLPPGTLVKKKLTTALRKLGFDRVFDTDFGADLTIMEECAELLKRFTNGGIFPMTTSCCPAYVSFVETFFPKLLPHVSSSKSPQQMFGAIAKTYYAKKHGIDPAKMVVVSIQPCTAKKSECNRPELKSSGFKDVDYVLTCRETARYLKQKHINLPELDDSELDMPLGESTGAGVIFGATGGVMEAALRNAYKSITGEDLHKLEFSEIRGLKGLKEGSMTMDGKKINFAVAHGLANARVLLDEIAAGKSKYHFIEFMACPGGCIGGGGSPKPTNDEVRLKRINAIYSEDRHLPMRKCYENPAIQSLYKDFLGEPLSEKAHLLLHTNYQGKNNG